MVTALIFMVTDGATRAAEADGQGQLIFEQKCQGCHSIGGGRMVGPDLKDVSSRRDRDWLISFITSPDTLIAQGDEIASQLVQEYGMEMPNMGLSKEEATAVLAYIETQSAAGPAQKSEEETALTPVLISADTGMGRDIFTGNIALRNGGAACISCHNVNGIAALGGGSMGKDLTAAYSTFGEAGLTSVLKPVPFPIMKEAYSGKPLTDDEIAHLVAFLREISDARQEPSTSSPVGFIVIGIAGFLVIAGILQLIWRGRLSGVRQLLVKGGSR
ncbi:MAG: c-type cytochrome [Dehalococcoidales bacterium]|nr:c-type cytochrome [Dehalococcoidales bacterium]